mmetsp:Transcript_100684/g.123286  ORF Transcript_100684/g.123286 Transcript_100684/m.123286 type:complete len:265 (+) Transcript_100684:35-829(+)
MALKMVDSIVKSDDMDELITYGYVRTYEGLILHLNINIPRDVIDIIYKFYKRRVLEIFGLRKDKKTQKIRFLWASNKKPININLDVVDISLIQPYCIHNIRQFLSSLLGINFNPHKYAFILFSRKGVIISFDENAVIKDHKSIYFYEIRHNHYINKQFGLLYDNPCKLCVIRVQVGKRNVIFSCKLPINVNVSTNIVSNIIKSIVVGYAQMKKRKNYDIEIKKIKVKHNDDVKITKPKDNILTDWDVSNECMVKFFVHATKLKV